MAREKKDVRSQTLEGRVYNIIVISIVLTVCQRLLLERSEQKHEYRLIHSRNIREAK